MSSCYLRNRRECPEAHLVVVVVAGFEVGGLSKICEKENKVKECERKI